MTLDLIPQDLGTRLTTLLSVKVTGFLPPLRIERKGNKMNV